MIVADWFNSEQWWEKKNKEDILKCHFCEEKYMRKLKVVNKDRTEDKTFIIMSDKYN